MASSRPTSFTLTAPGPLRLYSLTELLHLPPPVWLVKDILPAGGLVGLYGPPEQYKSFVAIDFAMSVSTGVPWRGHEVRKGHVLYVAAEGGTGIGIRAWGWLQDMNMKPEAADIAWLTESIPVAIDSENMDTLFNRIDNEIQQTPSLVVIDTLARCFDGNENEQEDMGRFVGGVDRLRREYGATVVIVHHTRLDADRERGNTAFRGAADTMIVVKRPATGEVSIVCDKQKEAERFDDMAFRMRVIELPPHPVDGVVRDTLVITEPAKERNAVILDWLATAAEGGLKFVELKERAASPGLSGSGSLMSPAALKRRLVSLLKTGEIAKENTYYYLSEHVPGSSKK